MNQAVNLGIIGDYDPQKVSHPATNDAIEDAASHASIQANVTWLPTPSMLTKKGQRRLLDFDCLWASSGSPYQSNEGMLKGIQIARLSGKPFTAT